MTTAVHVPLAARRPARPWRGAADLALLAYVAFLPVQLAASATSTRFNPGDVFLAGYLALRLPRLRPPREALSAWHAAVLAAFAVSVLVAAAADSLTSFAVIQKFIGIVYLFAACIAVVDFASTWRRLGQLLRTFVVSVALNSAVAALALVLQLRKIVVWPQINAEGARLAGFLIDPNAFGGLAAVAFLVLLADRFGPAHLLGRTTSRWCLFALGGAIVLTFSRSAWIGLVLGLTVLGALRADARRLLMRAALPLVAVVVAALVLSPQLSDLAKRPDQIAARTTIIGDAVGDYAAAPATGIGLGVFNVRHGVIVHNTSLFVLTELGPLGVFAIGGLLLSTVLKGLWSLPRAPSAMQPHVAGLLAGFAAMVGVSVGIEALYQRTWWLVIAALGAAAALVSARTAPTSAAAESAG